MTTIDDRREPAFGRDTEDRMTPTASSATVRLPVAGTALPVLDAQTLIDRLGLGNAIRVLRIKLAFPSDLFALAAQPLIDGVAEFVQMLPVSESGRCGQPGGQLYRALATAIRSLDRRRGQILPRGAAPEIIGELTHRWTYGVFVAGLLRDLVRVNEGLRVSIAIGSDRPRVWSPARGSMRSCGGFGYVWEALSPGPLSEDVDPAMARRLFECCVPAHIQKWLGEDPALMAELRACLNGQADPARAISELVGWKAPSHSLVQRQAASSGPDVLVSKPDIRAGIPGATDFAPGHSPKTLEDVIPDESRLAHQFLAWLRHGVRRGTLPVNTPDALVHVVAEGLLLASPRIFREFARQQRNGPESAAETARGVRRELLRQGWHLRTEPGVNIHFYEGGRSGRGTNRIHGIVLRDAQRFIKQLPPIDSTLVRLVASEVAQPNFMTDGISA